MLKRVSETIQNEGEKQKGGFLSMSLGELGASLLANILAGRGINRAEEVIVKDGYGKNGKGIVRAGHGNKMDF